mgnify:CR=1 FL=1
MNFNDELPVEMTDAEEDFNYPEVPIVSAEDDDAFDAQIKENLENLNGFTKEFEQGIEESINNL